MAHCLSRWRRRFSSIVAMCEQSFTGTDAARTLRVRVTAIRRRMKLYRTQSPEVRV